MHVSQILDVLDPLEVRGPRQGELCHLTCDSRDCRPGALFVAMRAAINDGHRFIADALQRGAAVIVCEQWPAGLELPEGRTCLLLGDSRKAMALLAHSWYGWPARSMRIIGITGTNGKTSTAYILKALLEAMGERVGMIGTTGIMIGADVLPTRFTTPELPELAAVLQRMRAAGVGTVVMEVSSHALALDRVHGIDFSAAVFTNLSQDHLDFHGTADDYARAKQLLFSGLSSSATAIFNGDDPASVLMAQGCPAVRQLRFGRAGTADLHIRRARLLPSLTSFQLQFSAAVTLAASATCECRMALVGAFNVENAAAALALGAAFGYAPADLCRALAAIPPVAGRMERVPLPGAATAIVDFAHSPDALAQALFTCRSMLNSDGAAGRLICLFGCGGDRDPGKRPLMGAVAAKEADIVILTNDNPRGEAPETIVQQIRQGIPAERRPRLLVELDRAAAIATALGLAATGDIVLIAGKGHENYQIIGKDRLPFSDRAEVQKFVAGAGAAAE